MSDTPKKKALVIDDDAVIARVLGQILENGGYETTAVTDPVAADALLHAEAFDIAFVDVNMPRIPGPELVRHCRDDGLKTEFVLVTGGIDDEQRDEAFHCGALTIIHKPFRVQDVIYAAELVFGTEDPQNSGPVRS